MLSVSTLKIQTFKQFKFENYGWGTYTGPITHILLALFILVNASYIFHKTQMIGIVGVFINGPVTIVKSDNNVNMVEY